MDSFIPRIPLRILHSTTATSSCSDEILQYYYSIKSNEKAGLLSTKAFLTGVHELIGECQRRNLGNRVVIYTKIHEMLTELLKTEQTSSEKKLIDFQVEKRKREHILSRSDDEILVFYNFSLISFSITHISIS